MRSRFFHGRRYWIIGASTGIGAALAQELHHRGAGLILSARNAPGLRSVAADCGGAEVVPFDLAEPRALDGIARDLTGQPPLDGIVCAAAIYDPGLFRSHDMTAIAATVATNLTGTMALARLAPDLLRPGGQLALVGSVAGYIGLPRGQPYSATKAAIASLCESLRVEYAPGVDVRLISPGFVRTRMTERNDFHMPHLIEPQEAARAIADGLAGRRFEVHFPRRFTWQMKLLGALPYTLSLRITRRLL